MRNKIIQHALSNLNPSERIFLLKYTRLLYGPKNTSSTQLIASLNAIDGRDMYLNFLSFIRNSDFSDEGVLEFYGSCFRRGDRHVDRLKFEMYEYLTHFPNLYELGGPKSEIRLKVYLKIVFGYGFFPGLFPKNELANRFTAVTDCFLSFPQNQALVETFLKIGRFNQSQDQRLNNRYFSNEDRTSLEADMERLNQYLAQ